MTIQQKAEEEYPMPDKNVLDFLGTTLSDVQPTIMEVRDAFIKGAEWAAIRGEGEKQGEDGMGITEAKIIMRQIERLFKNDRCDEEQIKFFDTVQSWLRFACTPPIGISKDEVLKVIDEERLRWSAKGSVAAGLKNVYKTIAYLPAQGAESVKKVAVKEIAVCFFIWHYQNDIDFNSDGEAFDYWYTNIYNKP